LAESDAERFKDFVFRGSSKPAINGKVQARKRATAADYMSSSSDEEGDQGLAEDSEEDISDEDDMDDGLDALAEGGDSDSDAEDDEMDQESDGEEDEDDQDDDESDSHSEDDESPAKKAAPRLVSGAATATPTSARPDLEKGIAIQKQRKTYDELLNLRIRLQKALVAANTFPLIDGDSIETPEPYEAAEEAAINLLNTISNLKDRFGQTGSKRKRELSVSMPSKELWEHLQEDEESLRQFRQDRLEKWSKKVQSATVTASSRLGAKSKTLINVLEDQLGDPTSRLVKRTRVARSCAPAQTAKRVTEDDYIYDDADFYQQLLKELVEQRTVDNAGEQIGAVPSVMLTAANSAKTRKVVDRKASKGRKMRFTVHEKLQNFMAPEDRRTWEQGAIDRLFNTLFGQKMEMDENESEGDDMDELQAQADGLRLFK
jgi:protein AATF/BFR2